MEKPLSGIVGAPPVQETLTVWFTRFLVWLTVTLRFAKSPSPDTVTAEPAGAGSTAACEADGESSKPPITAAVSIVASTATLAGCLIMLRVLVDDEPVTWGRDAGTHAYPVTEALQRRR